MHTVFYLTKNENVLFQALPDSLKEGWTVEHEKLSYEDTHELRQIRLELMRLDTKQMEDVFQKGYAAKTEEQLLKLVAGIELQHFSENDLREVFYALGPDALSYFIVFLLRSVKNNDELEGVCALSYIRHELLSALQSS